MISKNMLTAIRKGRKNSKPWTGKYSSKTDSIKERKTWVFLSTYETLGRLNFREPNSKNDKKKPN